MKRIIFLLIVCMMVLFSGAYTPPDSNDVNLTLGKTVYTPPDRNDVNLTLKSEVVVPPVDTCTYVSGDWNVDCSDNCLITSAEDIGGNNINIAGTGTFTTTADISNYNQLKMVGTDSNNRCIIKCIGGCFTK